jgi:hypothetical protein
MSIAWSGAHAPDIPVCLPRLAMTVSDVCGVFYRRLRNRRPDGASPASGDGVWRYTVD